MKRITMGVFKTALALLLIGSSGLSIYSHSLGTAFDPAREMRSLRNENGSDDDEMKKLEGRLVEYTTGEKAESFF